MFVVAHISDLHFNGTRYNRRRIEATLDYIHARAKGINALLVTGDITDEGSEAEYREAYGTLYSPLPMLITAGNHDHREHLTAALLGVESSAPVNRAELIDGVLFVVCDSSIPGRNDGHLSDETLRWMSEQITHAGPEVPVMVAFHHPPVTLGMYF
ncbi:MAG: metallophosphoesterase, partial [Actinomycetota bacterium]|nr:metallophosphoesterase [Actinomycetota bacterium]